MFIVAGSWHAQVRKNRLERFLTSVFYADDPKGGGQEARSNPAGNVVFEFSES